MIAPKIRNGSVIKLKANCASAMIPEKIIFEVSNATVVKAFIVVDKAPIKPKSTTSTE